MALADITNTQPNSQHMPTRQRKTINNIFSLRSNLYSDFVAASSASTGLLDNEILDRSFVPQHANDSLHHTNEALSDNNAENAGYVGLGDLSQICAYCQAAMWYQESTRKNRNQANPKYSLCCSMGRIHLPFLKNPPMLFQQLLCEEESCESKNYQQNIRAYNMMFAFNSPGAKIDTSLLKGKGLAIYKIHGQSCHLIGSLLPMPGNHQNLPNYIYIYIQKMKLKTKLKENLNLQLIVDKKKDGRIYNLPIVLKVVVVIVGDASQPINRDIILEKKNGRLQRINEFYPGYLGLQYPLLFPYGEDGYRSDIKHRDMDDSHERKRNKLTIRKQLHCVKYNTLKNSQHRVENQHASCGKRIILPSSFVGSRRYMDQLYFGGMTICSTVGFSDLPPKLSQKNVDLRIIHRWIVVKFEHHVHNPIPSILTVGNFDIMSELREIPLTL
ncbi:hypothetical protein D0Y65_023783 [Glycine soja]|uniref:Helitron helicase-like domain-containing protein n=1 Tax=Glycine soja TaxID=3848 RepID=A0A445IZG6_GLYSO|nr:hypothetical protein D0Y65_023783 [Glycine soja]